MPAQAPTLNLLCNIWRQYDFSLGPPTRPPDGSNIKCNLQYARKVHSGPTAYIYLLLPALTDVRDERTTTTDVADLIECPAGSKRWYVVICVDDMAKGFPTETRVAEMTHAAFWVSVAAEPLWLWPDPYP